MLFGLFWLLSGHWREKLASLRENRMAALLFLYYLWVLIGCFYSPQKGEAGDEIVSKIPFLIWPLLLGSVRGIREKFLRKLLFYYVMACLLSVLYCLTNATYDYFLSGSIREFFFVNLVEYKLVPPHYLGMYISFAYAMVLYRWFRKDYFLNRRADLVILALFVLAIVLISVRMQFLVFLILSFSIVFNYTRLSRGLSRAFLYSFALLLIFSSVVWAFPGSRHRVMDAYYEVKSFEKEIDDKQTNHRKFLWIAAWEVVEENFWMGTGTGAADYALNEKLAGVENAFWNGQDVYYLRDKFYNIHNAFLQHWAANGIIGFILIILIFIIPALGRIPAEARFFLLICTLSFLTESMLERQAGVLFFSFFYTLFFISPPSKKEARGNPSTLSPTEV